MIMNKLKPKAMKVYFIAVLLWKYLFHRKAIISLISPVKPISIHMGLFNCFLDIIDYDLS